MAFTVDEVASIAASTIEFHKRGKAKTQQRQPRPLLDALRSRAKTFPSGKDNITLPVKGNRTPTVAGFVHDDTVSYGVIANNKRATYPWKMLHDGFKITMQEFLIDGISVTDSVTGKGERNHSDRELTALTNLITEKYDDFEDGYESGLNLMYWKDGTQDAKAVPGTLSILSETPSAAATVGGIAQNTVTWWRNRVSLAMVTTTPSDLTITNTLQNEVRQLRRHGGRPTIGLAGSAFLEALEKEYRSKGYSTMTGWNSGGKVDLGTADMAFKGIDFVYDPTLDDLSKSKYLYLIDPSSMYIMDMAGEKDVDHTPARPETQYVYYKGRTYVGGLVCDRRNAHGIYSIA